MPSLESSIEDKHLVGVGVKEPGGVHEVGKMCQKQQPEDWSIDKTHNETDIIKTRVTRMIEQELQDECVDPRQRPVPELPLRR